MQDYTVEQVKEALDGLSRDDLKWIEYLVTDAEVLEQIGYDDDTAASLLWYKHEHRPLHPMQPKPQKEGVEKIAPSVMDDAGYVYLVRSASGHYKIGRTKDTSDRMRMFHVKLPFEVELVHSIPCSDCKKTEKFLHRYFSDKRVNGEWFALSEDDVNAIKAIESM